MELCQALGAKSVATMDQDAWDLLADVEPLATVVTKIKTSCLIITLNQFTPLLHAVRLLLSLRGFLSELPLLF